MSALELFYRYLQAIERRLRWRAVAGGAAVVAAALLVATVVLAAWADRSAFAEEVLFWARLGLFVVLGLALALAVAMPVLRVNRLRAARLAERQSAEFGHRAVTLSGMDEGTPFAELVARQAMELAQSAPPESVVRPVVLAGLSVATIVGFGVLAWLTLAGPGTLGYGARLLWAGAPPAGQGPIYGLQVKPGDARIRRGGDQIVEALLTGFDSPVVSLRARKKGDTGWQSLRMEPRPGGGGYAFLFAALADDVEYQVEAGRLKSAVHRLTVVDLPGVKKIRVTYHYPSYLGLKEVTEEPGGDVRAVEGTEAEVLVQTDRPLGAGALILDDGTRVALEPWDGLWMRGRLTVKKDGAYHVAAIDEGSPVRLTEDYFIEARQEKPPVIRISRPGRDAKVSPIEEVTIDVEASDDYGLQQVELKYSVNGGEEKSLTLGGKGAKEARQSATIALEDFKLAPGDVVAVSAAARDARVTSQTDIYFLEAQPFEKEYQQSQESGGGGGGGEGDQQTEIAQRQKEIIAATWNQIKAPKPRGQAEEDAKFLEGVQQKLSAQAKSLAERMRSRQLAAANEEFKKFSAEMDQAALEMNGAAGRLKSQQWKDALGPEQRALQHLLRAESMFRQIQVAFGQRGGGGGGGGGGQMRDLESLFDLELDREKNQYETAQSGGSSAADRERQVDEALKKLEDLARRQQQAAQQRQNQQQSFQQKWAQEMLRREAEELRRRLEELQNGQQEQSGQQQAGQQGSGQQSSSSRQQAGDSRMTRTQQQLERAIDDMRKAQAEQGQSSADSARRAAERMAEARDSMTGMRRQQAGDRMEDLSKQASDLAGRQKQYEEQIRKAFPGEQPGAAGQRQGQGQSQANTEQMAREKEAMERDYRKLEQGMREATRALSGSQKGAANRLREALGEAQQNELGIRLKFGSDWIRRGLGPYLAPRERVVTEMLDKLSQQVSEAKQMAGKEGSSPEKDNTERALNQIESLRSQVAREVQRQQGQRGQQGQQGQQGQGGQQGQMGRQGQSQNPGGQQGGFGNSFQRGEYSAMNDGTRRDLDNPGRGLEQSYDNALRQLQQLRSEAASDESQSELERIIRQMQRLDPRQFPGNPALLGRIETEILPQLEQLELRLRKQLDSAAGAPARATNPAKAPPGYSEAVAEYYRRLSRSR